MVTTMPLSESVRRALRNHHYERTPQGLMIERQLMRVGGVMTFRENDGPWQVADNTMTYQFFDALLSAFFTGAGVPTGFYVAPFTNNVAPAPSLTAANFATLQGEYTGYTQGARPTWTPNGPSVSQTVSNSAAPAQFTVGTAAATIYGAGILTAPGLGATTGVLVAAAQFGTANTLSPGSTLSVQYSLSASPAA